MITAAQVQALEDATSNAYSKDAYRDWNDVCMELLYRYSHDEAVAILRSKWARWAADASGKRHGICSATDLIVYLEKNITLKRIGELVEETIAEIAREEQAKQRASAVMRGEFEAWFLTVVKAPARLAKDQHGMYLYVGQQFLAWEAATMIERAKH
jgi:hypothetical protein